MLWKNRRESSNVEDRRGFSGGGGIALGGGFGTIVIIVLALLFGVDPRQLLDPSTTQPDAGQAPAGAPNSATEDDTTKFTRVVLADTEDVWNNLFQQIGRRYEEPRMVLFAGRVQSACGLATSAVGPFYCPGDNQVYLDTSFFDELHRRFGAPGDFAQAYVIAHEIGHHVQNQLGTMRKVDAQRSRLSEAEANRLSVRVELQADFYAGVWAHYVAQKGYLEGGDVEEALRAASAIGDDRLQREGQGYVVPDSFTHGTSEQRVRWFRKGYESGDLRQGDTFSVPNP